MTSLARYHGRSPRYILSTEDDSLIRVAGPKQTPWEEGTEIRNVSLTGLAFTAPDDLCPLLGEVIKIQFTPPGSKQMACYKMDMAVRIVLAQGLARRFKENHERGEIDNLMNRSTDAFTFGHLPQIMMMAILGGIWCLSMFSLFRLQYSGIANYLKSFL